MSHATSALLGISRRGQGLNSGWDRVGVHDDPGNGSRTVGASWVALDEVEVDHVRTTHHVHARRKDVLGGASDDGSLRLVGRRLIGHRWRKATPFGWLVVAFAALLLALPAAASAHKADRRANPTARALVLAQRYWHTYPCDGHITITYAMPPADDAVNPGGAPTSMWSEWVGARGEGANDEGDVQPFTSCIIGINSAVWKSQYMMGYSYWAEFSIDIVHEFGHLVGLPDLFSLEDTQNIMYIEPSADARFTGVVAPGWGEG
jgi:hypothetical protein